jgi:hypothetical protein
MEKVRWVSILRDLLCMGTGTFGLVYSQVTGVISPELVAAYVTLLGVPGVVNLWALRRGSSDTESESPDSHSRASSGRSSKGSRRGTGED